MGFIAKLFGGGQQIAPPPEPLPLPVLPDVPAAPNQQDPEARQRAQSIRDKAKRAAGAGRAGTVLGSKQGLESTSKNTKKTLLGT